MGEISAKQRIIKIMEILDKETDEENFLSLEDIINRLKEEFSTIGGEYYIERKAVRDDINEIIASGFSVNIYKGMKGKNLYYHCERPFEIYELRLLIDAVSSARFITKDETEIIINKIKGLTSKTLKKKLENKIHLDGMVKSENKKLKYYLDELHSAISSNKKVIFQYGNYNVNKEFVLHHNGTYYEVNPYALVWSNDFYYLVCEDISKGHIIDYRVDRMNNVKMLDDSFKRKNFDVTEHLKRCFNMYPGEEDVVEIQFVNKLINAVIDKFGRDVTIIENNTEHFVIRIKAAINEGLLRWVLMWGADAKVLYPPKLVSMIKNESKKMNKQY